MVHAGIAWVAGGIRCPVVQTAGDFQFQSTGNQAGSLLALTAVFVIIIVGQPGPDCLRLTCRAVLKVHFTCLVRSVRTDLIEPYIGIALAAVPGAVVVTPLIFVISGLCVYVQIDNGIRIDIQFLDAKRLFILFPSVVRGCGLEFFALKILLSLRSKGIAQLQITFIHIGMADHLHMQQFFRNQLIQIAVAVGIHHMLWNHLAVHLIENDHNPAGNPVLIKASLFADFFHGQHQTFVPIDKSLQVVHRKGDGR